MPTTADIAEALVAELNATAFSRPFTAVRAYLPRYDLGEMDTLHVTVVATGRGITPAARKQLQIDHRIDIAVQQKVVVEDTDACDALAALVAEIAGHLTTHHVQDAPEAMWVRTEHTPLI